MDIPWPGYLQKSFMSCSVMLSGGCGKIYVITAQRDKYPFHSNELKHIGQKIRINDL